MKSLLNDTKVIITVNITNTEKETTASIKQIKKLTPEFSEPLLRMCFFLKLSIKNPPHT